MPCVSRCLTEIQRVLAPAGILIDLRPLAGSWPIEVASAREIKEAGRVTEMPIGMKDDQAANQAIANPRNKSDSSVNAKSSFRSFIIGIRQTK